MTINNKTGRAAAVLAAAWLGMTIWSGQVSGQNTGVPGSSELIDPADIPSVHNTLYEVPEGAISWDLLAEVSVEAESVAPTRSVFRTKFADEVAALDQQTVEIMGFLFPLEGRTEHEHFLLTAWPPGCPFCLPAGPTQMVDVFAAEPIEFGEGAILIEGRFELLENAASGLYYRLNDAKLVARFEDIRWTGQELTQ